MTGSSRALSGLIDKLEALPGIGPKSAQRVAMYLLHSPPSVAEELAQALMGLREGVRTCRVCFNYADEEVCPICSDEERDQSVLCVMADSVDVAAMERTKRYKGRYHVLQGLIAPMEGVGPERLTVAALFERLDKGEVKEVILALDPSVEGEATALYLGPLLQEKGVRVTKLGLGLPAGGDLDYADQLTLTMALEGRREM
jgi:recombination protein RecR